ncbi:MAG TPA: DoxX family protein [Candidatus Dormibacteraeota bacterium]|nr:DoxX family protein [Candidatus Dormibacteraeota bacterium]
MDVALLLVRIIVGLYFAAHGSQKLLGWFGGPGLVNAGGFFEQLGFRPGRPFALLASVGELAAGLLIFLGLGGALGPVLLVMVMLVAIFSVHVPKGWFAQNGGVEMNLLYIAGGLALAFGGYGAYSLDRVFGLNVLSDPMQIWIALAVAAVLAALNLLARRVPKAE